MPATPLAADSPPAPLTASPRADRLAVALWAVLLGAGWLWYCRPLSDRPVTFLLGVAIAAPILGLADQGIRGWLRRQLSPYGPVARGALIWALLFALVEAAAPADQRISPSFIIAWAFYLAMPIVILGGPWRDSPGARLVLCAVAIVIPFAVGVVPTIRLTIADGMQPPVGLLLALDLALMLLLVYRSPAETGPVYRFWLPRRELALALAVFAGIAALVLPAALAMGFIRPGLGQTTMGGAAGRLLNLFFLVALPEEVVFRGVLQDGLERLLGKTKALALAALLFGLAHVGHAPAPNWRYVALASVAGVGYGWVYQKTRSLATGAVTHALVDWTWFVFFAGLIGT
jgi:membrane protease YdiL (CAAX protease family)